MGPSFSSTLTRLNAIENHLVHHGWVLNHDKRREPFRAGDLLGIHVDLTHHTTQPTAVFRSSLNGSATHLLSHPTRHHVQKLLGSTIWAAQADPSYLYYTHHLVHSIKQTSSHKNAPVRLTPSLVNEVQALSHHALNSTPVPIPSTLPPPQHLVYTDASSSIGAMSHVARHAVGTHIHNLDKARTHKPSITNYTHDIQHTFSFAPDPSLHITDKEALSLDTLFLSFFYFFFP